MESRFYTISAPAFGLSDDGIKDIRIGTVIKNTSKDEERKL